MFHPVLILIVCPGYSLDENLGIPIFIRCPDVVMAPEFLESCRICQVFGGIGSLTLLLNCRRFFLYNNVLVIYNKNRLLMYNNARVFNSGINQVRRGEFGQQVNTSFKYGIVQQGEIKYKKCPQWKQAESHVDKFISDSGSQLEKFKMFKSILRQKVINGKQRTKLYNLNEIADFLPWVFSTQFLFEPFRSIIYCLKTGQDPINALVVAATVPSELINNVVDQAILQSIKYQNTYIQTAKNIFGQEHVGWQTKLYAVSVNTLADHLQYVSMLFQKATQGTLVTSLNQYFTLFAKTFIGEKATTFLDKLKNEYEKIKPWKTDSSVKDWKSTILNFIKQLFKHLRPYGSIIINFGYLMHCAQVKVIGGQQFFYFWDHPQILINCRQSIVQVYLNVNGTLSLIPQQSFDINFLRSIVMDDVIKMGGRLFKQLNTETTKTKQQKQAFTQFGDKYLKWKVTDAQQSQNQKQLVSGYADLMRDMRKQQFENTAKGFK